MNDGRLDSHGRDIEYYRTRNRVTNFLIEEFPNLKHEYLAEVSDKIMAKVRINDYERALAGCHLAPDASVVSSVEK